MTKVLLVALYDHFSKGIRGLHSFLAVRGYDVSSIYFMNSTYDEGLYGPQDMMAFVDKVRELKPDFIGIGVRSPLFPLFVDMSNHIRAHFPHIPIIAGGPHATATPETCLPYADYVVGGDGEYPILDILKGVYGKGVTLLRRFEDLDSLPFQHYGENTYSLRPVAKPFKFSVYSTRGCFFNCTYCQESILRQSPVRKSVEYLKSEIDFYCEKFPSIKLITLSDSNFLYDEEWLEQFARAFKGSGLHFWCAGNAKIITKEMVKLAKDAGIQAVRIGVQSGSDKMRREVYNRKDTLDEILEVANMLHSKNIVGHYDFIIENPYDTPETIAETRRFIRKLPMSAVTNKFELRYWPGTRLTDRALKDGYLSPDDVEGNFMRFGTWTYIYQVING